MVRSLVLALGTLYSAPMLFAQSVSQDEIFQRYEAAMELGHKGKFTEAAAAWEKLLPEAERVFGKKGKNTATIFNNMGFVFANLDQYDKAEDYHLQSLRIREANGSAVDIAHSLNNLATMYHQSGRFNEAESAFERCLSIREKELPEDHPDLAMTLNNYGSFCQDSGQYDRADSFYRRSLAIHQKKFGAEHSEVARVLNNLGVLYKLTGQYARAEESYQKSLAIWKKREGESHVEVGRSFNNLAGIYQELSQYDKAEKFYLDCLKIWEEKLGKDHLQVATALTNLGSLERDRGNYEKAEPLFLRGLEIREAKLGKKHPAVATSLNNLAGLYLEMENPKKAAEYFQLALAIREEKLGPEHPLVAQALGNVGRVLSYLGEYEKAEEHLSRSLAVLQKRMGENHPHLAVALNLYGWNLAYQQKWYQAVENISHARRTVARHLTSTLPTLSEKEKLAVLEAHYVSALQKALSLAFVSPDAVDASAEWLLNGKAIVHQSLAEQVLLARTSTDPSVQAKLKSLGVLRARLAALSNRLPQVGKEDTYRKDLQALKASEEEVAQKLARLLGGSLSGSSWVTLDNLRSRLGAKTAFVDIARIAAFDFKARKSNGVRYAAWITTKDAKITFVDLGDADAIDQLVERARQSLLKTAREISVAGETDAVAELQKPLAELSAKVLHPLLTTLSPCEEWIICPDGALWLTPWNALLLPKGEYAVEKHLIRHVVSGRDLVRDSSQEKVASAVIFADPDYDQGSGKKPASAAGLGNALIGKRLPGSLEKWNLSFEFLPSKEVIICDEDAGGKFAGRGAWKIAADTLTIYTATSVFIGTFASGEIRGERTKKDAKGAIVRDHFRIQGLSNQPEVRESAAHPRVPRLPGTAQEATAVKPLIQQWLKTVPDVYLEDKATETALKALAPPRFLMLATHGFFLPRQEMAAKLRHGADAGDISRSVKLVDREGQPLENPLLRCGLLLAACNHRDQVKPGDDDGVLTGLEIVGLNLHGCELVVLSACETGLGDLRNGEGVAGLRQAFQFAGARNVLASLWQVPDRDTAILMNGFYAELTKGKSRAEALRQAQLQRIASRKERYGVAHPFFWAAFALTSQGE